MQGISRCVWVVVVKPPLIQVLPVWVGIDPGMAGALAVIDEAGKYLRLWDMPITTMGRSGEIDVDSLASIVDEITKYPAPTVLLEWPQTRPDEAPESSKRFGVGLGLLEGMFTYAGLRPRRVAPNEWKGHLRLKGKERDALGARSDAVRLALEVIPNLPGGALHGARGGLKDGRAEALLIAWEGLTRTVRGLARQPEDLRFARLVLRGGRGRKKWKGPPL